MTDTSNSEKVSSLVAQGNSCATNFSAPFIQTDEWIGKLVDESINLWINEVGLYSPRTPNERTPERHQTVSEFAAKMVTWRDRALRMKNTGAVRFRDNDNLSWVAEIPILLDKIMCLQFGNDWKQDYRIWKTFRDKFKMGFLNPNSKCKGLNNQGEL